MHHTHISAQDAVEAASGQLAKDLATAISSGHLEVVYQPVVDCRSRRIVAAEALLRWHHPTLGQVPPHRFIPLAEHTGLIHQLGWYVLTTALTCQRTLTDRFPQAAPEFVTVNVSPAQLQDGFPDMLAAVLDATGCRPSMLTIEITESAPLATGHTTTVVQHIADMGVGVAIDDFGAGYSSLARLAHLPASILKLDRVFLDNLETNQRVATTVAAVLKLAHQLGLQAIAEGVTSPHQLRWLADHGCTLAQGGGLYPPLDTATYTRLIATQAADSCPQG